MKPRKKKRRMGSGERQRPDSASLAASEAAYVCDACGEEIVIPVDPSQGREQEYVEDCPVCCQPNLIRVELDERGDVRAWAEKE